MSKLQDIKIRLIDWVGSQRRLIKFRLLLYRMSQNDKKDLLQEMRYLVWCRAHGRSIHRTH